MKDMLKFKLKNYLGENDQEVFLERTTYANNGALALLAYFPDDDGQVDPDYPDVLSINLESAPSDKHTFYGDSGCHRTLEALTNIGFIKPIGQVTQGLGTYTLFRIADKYWDKLIKAERTLICIAF